MKSLKPHLLRGAVRAALTLLSFALLALTSCSITNQGQQSQEVIETRNGAMIIDTVTKTATVTAIDANTRQLTLTAPDGKKTTVKVAPGVDLSEAKVGEQITVQATEEIAVVLSKPGTPTSVGAGGAVDVAARGREQGVMATETEEVTARIIAVDVKHRKVALKFVDGSTKTVKVGNEVNLAAVAVGDEVTAQVAQSMAVVVRK
jgi:hypothetical protein